MYKVLIKRTSNVHVAKEIAKYSGTTLETINSALSTKDICIRKEVDNDEAQKLKERFEKIGATVILKRTTSPTKALSV